MAAADFETVGTAYNSGASAVTTTGNFPITVTGAVNYIVVALFIDNATDVTGLSATFNGSSMGAQIASAGNEPIHVFGTAWAGGAGTFNASLSWTGSRRCQAQVVAFTGVDTGGTPVSDVSTESANTGTSSTGVDIANMTADDIAALFWDIDQAAGSVTPGSGQVERWALDGTSSASRIWTLTGVGTLPADLTWADSVRWCHVGFRIHGVAATGDTQEWRGHTPPLRRPDPHIAY